MWDGASGRYAGGVNDGCSQAWLDLVCLIWLVSCSNIGWLLRNVVWTNWDCCPRSITVIKHHPVHVTTVISKAQTSMIARMKAEMILTWNQWCMPGPVSSRLLKRYQKERQAASPDSLKGLAQRQVFGQHYILGCTCSSCRLFAMNYKVRSRKELPR